MVAQWVAEHSALLNIGSTILGVFSLIFGGKALGRFLLFSKPGGIYSSLLVGIPNAFLVGVIFYLVDSESHFLVTTAVSQGIQRNISPLLVASIYGAVSGLLSMVVLPERYRVIDNYRLNKRVENGEIVITDEQVRSVYARMIALSTVGSIVLVFGGLLTLEHFVYLGLDALRIARPPINLALLIVILLELILVSGPIVLAWNLTGGKVPTEKEELELLNKFKRPQKFGCLVISIGYVALGGTTYAVVATAIRYGGWVVIGDLSLLLLGAMVIFALRYLADRLSTKQLLAVFAFPSVVGGMVGFFANFPDLLRFLP